jgi:hypothetical protein
MPYKIVSSHLWKNFSKFNYQTEGNKIFLYANFIIRFERENLNFNYNSKCMTKMENFAESRKVAHILKVWSLLSTKIPISSKSVENSSVMSHSPAAPPVFTNSAQSFRITFQFIKTLDIFGKPAS